MDETYRIQENIREKIRINLVAISSIFIFEFICKNFPTIPHLKLIESKKKKKIHNFVTIPSIFNLLLRNFQRF